jgi:hypothetical protein
MSESERIFLFFLGLVILVASSLLIGYILWRLLWTKVKGEITHCRLSSFEEEMSSGVSRIHDMDSEQGSGGIAPMSGVVATVLKAVHRK